MVGECLPSMHKALDAAPGTSVNKCIKNGESEAVGRTDEKSQLRVLRSI